MDSKAAKHRNINDVGNLSVNEADSKAADIRSVDNDVERLPTKEADSNIAKLPAASTTELSNS